MDYLMFWLIIFAVVFLIYFLWINRRRLKKEKYHKMVEINYLVNKYKLSKNKIDYQSLGNVIALANALIIATVSVITMIIPLKFIFQMLIAFVLVIATILIVYNFIGKYLAKKGDVKNAKHQGNRKKVAKKVGRK